MQSWNDLYEQVAKDVCREKFSEFVKEFWDCVVPEPCIWNWHMDVICEELQKVFERVEKGLPKIQDTIINVPPGTSKSTLISVLFPVWGWVRKPSFRFICSSYAHPLALSLSIRCRDLLRSEKFIRYYGDIVKIRKDQDQKSYYKTTHNGERFCASTNGSVTGMHAHIIIMDDPVNPQEAFSETLVKQANRWVDETLLSRKVDKAVTPYVLVMQRLAEYDVTGHMLEKKNPIRHICLPAEESDNIKPAELRERYIDGLLDPLRMPKAVLENMRVDLGEYGYAGQFLQNPYPIGNGMFDVEKFKITPVPPYKVVKEVRYWDKAGTAGGGAYSVGVKMGLMSNKQFIILDVVRGQWNTDKRENIIKQTAYLDGVKTRVWVEQEPGSGGKESAEGTIRNLAGYNIKAERVHGDKVMRADPLSVQINSENVYVIKAPWVTEYFGEFRAFPVGKYKDQVDATSGAFNALVSSKRAGTWASKKS